MSAALTAAADHLVVGEHGPQCGAPVDLAVGEEGQAVCHQNGAAASGIQAVPLGRRERAIEVRSPRGESRFVEGVLADSPIDLGVARRGEQVGQRGNGARFVGGLVVPVFEKAAEDPLGPAVVVRAAGPHFPAPIVAEAEQVELAAVAGDVALGGDRWVLAGLDGVLLSRQAKAVIALRMEDIESTLALVAGDDVRGDVAQGVTDMQTCSTGVGEHVEHVVLLLVGSLFGLVGALLGPLGPPLGLDGLEVVFHCPAR